MRSWSSKSRRGAAFRSTTTRLRRSASPIRASRCGPGDNAFNADVWEVRRANANEKYTLLFVLDATLVGLTPEQTLTLQAQFPPKDRADQPVPFTNLKNRSFTPPRSIPNSGNMKAARK